MLHNISVTETVSNVNDLAQQDGGRVFRISTGQIARQSQTANHRAAGKR